MRGEAVLIKANIESAGEKWPHRIDGV